MASMSGNVSEPIYLDHAATTPIRPEVRAAILPFLDARFGNPSSAHRFGREARAALEEARERVAGALGARRREIVFTSGGTEADNLAVLGAWRKATGSSGGAGGGAAGDVAASDSRATARPGRALACSAVEHKAVLAALHAAGAEGAEQLILAVDEEGRLDTGALDEALAARPVLVSVMWANNEVGTLQPVAEVAERCRAAGVLYHTDAVQAFGKVRVRVDEVPLDLLAVSGHKINAPKGIGALYVREGVLLEPLVHGGAQEGAVRPGTENVALAVGLGVAAELAAAEQATEARRLEALRDRLQGGLCERIPGLLVNGGGAPRVPQTLNVSLPGVDRDALLVALDLEGIAVSTGAACQSGVVEPSHVLTAMGRVLPDHAAIRFSLGHTTTAAEIERTLEVLPRVIERLRALASV